MDVLFICGIFMSFFIAFLLLTKRNKALSDKILATWVTVIGLHLLSYYLYHLGFWEQYPHLIGTTAPFPLLHGPLLYLYTLYSLRSDARVRRIDYLHFAPVVVAYLYMTRFFFFYTAEQKMMVDNGELPDFAVFSSVLLIAFIISGIAYPIIAYRLTIKHRQKIDHNFSYEEGINLNWLRTSIWGIGLIFLSVLIVTILRDLAGVVFSFNADFIFYTLIILFIFYVGYFGIRHQDMFTHNENTVGNGFIQHPAQTKYQRSGLKPDVLDQHHQKLLEFMDTKKPYLEPKLNLGDLAKQLEISPNQLSQVINQKERANFHDFVNRYRIEEFINQAKQNRQYSLLAIALDSGFNSKSSFNSVFKKQKGMTPSAFIAKNN